MTTLSQYFQIHRRYYRSVNLERDLGKASTVEGYVLTERSTATLERILPAFSKSKTHRAWTLTGVYGTGKSAFIHFLASLCTPKNTEVHNVAVTIAERFLKPTNPILEAIAALPNQGLVVAFATGQQEPLTWTLARALSQGAEDFFSKNQRADKLLRQLTDWKFEAETGDRQVTPKSILRAIKELVAMANTPLLIIVDELGKNLEYAAQNQGITDLYLLQQLAELSLTGENQVYFIGLLHQSFGGYGDRLSVTEQNEWNKIQGRFEDIPFTESPNQMTRLIAQVIDREKAESILETVQEKSGQWHQTLSGLIGDQETTPELLTRVYPLHPLTAFVLPLLCTRYAQNDRSLFTFLTSDEPHSFKHFLETIAIDFSLPTLKLHHLYDYFVETVTGLASRLNLQRWVEIQGLIEDARDQSPQTLEVLKTVGILNLVTTTGNLKATSALVTWALCDQADSEQSDYWQAEIEGLMQKGLITHRRQLDELRIWEGSDFNVELAIAEQIEKNRSRLADLLQEVYPLKPLVAQRHYNQTGNLRYFEQRYTDGTEQWENLTCSDPSFDGLILYWLDTEIIQDPPKLTADHKPLILIAIHSFDLLRTRSREFQALQIIYKNAPELQNDGVARREVRHRLLEAERLLDEAIAKAFSWSSSKNKCWITGEVVIVKHARTLQSKLSALCDQIYVKGIQLDNELINRRELTSQGSKARRELIVAMIEKSEYPRLGLEGYGPEVTMYASLLEVSHIHRLFMDDEWGFMPPKPESGLATAWEAIEDFCMEAKEKPRTLDGLYKKIEQPPYGIKQGVIPILLTAVLIHHMDDIGIYQDGTFIPLLGVEHLELLIRYPERFAVKSFEIAGIRAEVFKELESILKSPNLKPVGAMRNTTLLTVVSPLYQFAKKLPRYTQQSQQCSPEARKTLSILKKTVEPDELLFVGIPEALGLEPILTDSDENQTHKAQLLKRKLVEVLKEIHGAYDALLSRCQFLIYQAFGIQKDSIKLREDLGTRSKFLFDQCVEPLLKRFLIAACDHSVPDRQWLEALLMIIADKPAESWTDQDETQFEIKLADISRRFKNLEALQKDIEPKGDTYEARRITVTRPDGQEENRMVWIERQRKAQAQETLNRILGEIDKEDPQLQQVILMELMETLLKRLDKEQLGKLKRKNRLKE
ncbi:hypothetical protein [Synechocystis sp. FACHB-383]|uniref:hypothetical protein n=1 Tax=Synechocystis sp. FACHB-383 TaxID=2692864 RepID=UPI001F556420|nr:hypothetical protein [Synechocystis sp. FACHB-383]